jgi:hypothetical protein
VSLGFRSSHTSVPQRNANFGIGTLDGNILTSGLGAFNSIVPLYLAIGRAHFALQRRLSPDNHTG